MACAHRYITNTAAKRVTLKYSRNVDSLIQYNKVIKVRACVKDENHARNAMMLKW